MADMYAVNGETLTGIADAIRLKTGGTAPIGVDDMAMQIGLISGGGDSSIVRGTVTLDTADNYLRVPNGGMTSSDKFIFAAMKDGEKPYGTDACYGFVQMQGIGFGTDTGGNPFVGAQFEGRSTSATRGYAAVSTYALNFDSTSQTIGFRARSNSYNFGPGTYQYWIIPLE